MIASKRFGLRSEDYECWLESSSKFRARRGFSRAATMLRNPAATQHHFAPHTCSFRFGAGQSWD